MSQTGKRNGHQRGKKNHRPEMAKMPHRSAAPPAENLQGINNCNQIYHSGGRDKSRPQISRRSRNVRASPLKQMRGKIENP